MTMPPMTALTGGTIFTGDDFIEDHVLLMQDRHIVDIAPKSKIPLGAEIVACDGHILAPGLIDCQVNGGGNILFNTADNVAAVTAIVKAHARHGTTRVVLTFISDKPSTAQRGLNLMRDARRQCPGILGIHFEGPHLNTERRGVHKVDMLRDLKPEDMKLYQPGSGETMIVTLAPERVSADVIAALHGQGVIVSLGHSAADTATIRAALKAGATGFTHIFDGTGGIEARRPGLAGIGLDDTDSWCSVIADGHHVDAEVLRLACRAKKPGKLMLVSDAMPPAGADAPRTFNLYGETIQTEKGRCTTSGGRLAGSAVTLDVCVRTMIRKAGVEPAEALRMASAYPAAFLGLSHQFGKLHPSFTADVVMLTPEYEVKAAWVDGQKQ